MTIAADIQKYDAGALITLYELDATVQGGDVTRFHDGTNELKTDIIWDGDTYSAFPIEVVGYEKTSGGVLPRPIVRVANADGVIAGLVNSVDDLIGAKFTRIRTFEAYIDDVNFSGGTNPSGTADPSVKFTDDVYYISQKTLQNKEVIEFELTASFDVVGKILPGRIAIQNVCPWIYRGTECGYVGSNYWDTNDIVVALLADDVCGKRLESCKNRFGTVAQLPFGGFPGLGLIR